MLCACEELFPLPFDRAFGESWLFDCGVLAWLVAWTRGGVVVRACEVPFGALDVGGGGGGFEFVRRGSSGV